MDIKSLLKEKKYICGIAVVIVIIIIIAIASQMGTKTSEGPSTETEETKVVTIEIFQAFADNWDADAEVDGIKLELRPKDSEGNLVKTEGTVKAELYESHFGLERKGDFIQSWEIKITKNDYDYMNANLQLEYKEDYKPEYMELGWLEVTLTTPDGKTFEAREGSVNLREL